MSETTGIGWTHHTFNIAWGCMKVSPGCANCYAESFSKRTGHSVFGPAATTARRTFGEQHWREPLRWDRMAGEVAERRRVFCSSMADVFEDHPTIDAEREKLWPLIHATPWLDWQLLTKRPERIAERLPADWGDGYPNVWLGTSIESQDYVGRLASLVAIPASVRFVSAEPLLGPLDLRAFAPHVDWVITGGESGKRRRAMDLLWLVPIVHQAQQLGHFRLFVKQDSHLYPGRQGRLPDHWWALKEFPEPRVAQWSAA
jgi:protein gp37